jgi:hypothetical protein
VVTKPLLVLDHVEVNSSAQLGVVPGASVTLGIYVRNAGEGDATDVTATVAADSSTAKWLEDVSNDSGGPVFIGYGQQGVLLVSPQIVLSPSLPLNEPVKFTIVLNDGGSGLQWKVPFEVTAFKSAALVWVTEIEITGTDSGDDILEPGESGTFRAYAENLGFASVNGVTAQVSVKGSGGSIGAQSPVNLSFGDPTEMPIPAEPQMLIEGTVSVKGNHPAGEPLPLRFTITEPGGTEWIQDVDLPISQ